MFLYYNIIIDTYKGITGFLELEFYIYDIEAAICVNQQPRPKRDGVYRRVALPRSVRVDSPGPAGKPPHGDWRSCVPVVGTGRQETGHIQKWDS